MKDQGLWTWHVAAGVVILVFLGLHMGVMHLEAVLGLPFSPAGGHPIDWGNVVARAKSAFFAVTYVVLLGAALFHGLYGARNVLFELGPGPAVKKTVNGVFLVAGLGLFVLGTWAAWATFVLARAQLINELVEAGKIQFAESSDQLRVTFHDPCYLGRHNQVFDAPREDLKAARLEMIEMPCNKRMSFCCGAGGAQMWKEEEQGTSRVNARRFAEAKATGAQALVVGCPFCMIMLTDASKADGGAVNVMDVAEIVAKRLKA